MLSVQGQPDKSTSHSISLCLLTLSHAHTDKLQPAADSQMQRALAPALAAHDGGEADVVEHGRGGEASRRVLTWWREESYRRQEQVRVERFKEGHEGQSVTSAVIKKNTWAMYFLWSVKFYWPVIWCNIQVWTSVSVFRQMLFKP